jgi:hypothetical protein
MGFASLQRDTGNPMNAASHAAGRVLYIETNGAFIKAPRKQARSTCALLQTAKAILT